jgi:hypothetical protein
MMTLSMEKDVNKYVRSLLVADTQRLEGGYGA